MFGRRRPEPRCAVPLPLLSEHASALSAALLGVQAALQRQARQGRVARLVLLPGAARAQQDQFRALEAALREHGDALCDALRAPGARSAGSAPAASRGPLAAASADNLMALSAAQAYSPQAPARAMRSISAVGSAPGPASWVLAPSPRQHAVGKEGSSHGFGVTAPSGMTSHSSFERFPMSTPSSEGGSARGGGGVGVAPPQRHSQAAAVVVDDLITF